MARYAGDQNQVTFSYESGTYASTSGAQQWIGLVQNNDIDDATGVIPVRYVGTGDRNVDLWVDGPRDVTGTFSYFPQDWKLLGYALGSIVDAGSPSPYTHALEEVNSASGNAFTSGIMNPFLSFTVTDSQKGSATGQNFIRTAVGAMVDTWTMTASQGDIIQVEVNYRAQDTSFTSGALGAVTASTTRPFQWSDVQVHKPSGTVLEAVKDLSFSINNNIEAPHYLNGSRQIDVPIPLSRDYEMSLTLDGTSEESKTLWETNFISGTEFNLMLEVTDAGAGAGSRDMFAVLSGCKIIDMTAPSPMEGVNEQTLTIRPKTVSVLVNDTIELYNIF